MNDVQFIAVAAVVVIGSAHNEFLSLKLSVLKQLVYLGGILLFTLFAVVIVIMVEEIDLCRQSCLFECRRHAFHETCLLIPGHIARCAIAWIQRFVLRTYGIDIDIKDITYDEIKDYKIVNENNVEEYPNETIPTIDDYLKIIKNSNKCAVIELKNVPTYEDLVRLSNIVDSYELDGRVEFISFAANMLKQMKDIYDEKELENSPSFTFLSITPSISLSNLDGLMPYEWAIQNNMNFGCFTMFITKELSEMMHSNNLGLFSFTIENYYTAYEQLSLYGVDAIAINDPLLMD